VSGRGPVGFVGLGAIGAPIAEALLDAGHELLVCDSRHEATEPFAGRAAVAETAGEVGDAAEVVLASLPTPDVVREVGLQVFGRAAVRTFVDLSTTGPTAAAGLAASAGAAGIEYLDAPVSGGVAGARARTLTVMASGDEGVFERVRPLLEAFASNVFHVGADPGQGQLVKLLNNLLSATAMAITAEAITFGIRSRLDPGVLLDVFNASSGRNSATLEKFPRHVLTRSFASGFRLKLMTKDVELCLSEARRAGQPMPVGGLVQQLWTLAAAHARDEDDHTEFVRLAEQWTDVTVAGTEVARAGS